MKKIFLIALLLSAIQVNFAGDVSRKGTTGAEQLLIPVGARGIASGSALLANLSGIESIYYNPAGLDLSGKTEAMFSYMNYIADINVSYFAASTSLGEIGTIALSFKTFDFGDIPVTTNEFPDGIGKTYSPSFLTIGLTYSKVLTDRISVGTNLKLISETIENSSASGFAIDVGVQYRFNQEISLAATLKNLGTNMAYSGQSLRVRTDVPGGVLGSTQGTYEVVTEPFQIPSFFEMSLGYKFNFNEQNNLLIASTFVANNSLEDKVNFGLEYSYLENFFLRGGYNLALGGQTEKSIFGFTAGAGVNYSFEGGLSVSFDYAFREVKEFPTANHIITLKLGIE